MLLTPPSYFELAQLQQGIYGTLPVEWDWWTGPDAEVVWGKKKVNGVTVVVFRGSITPMDWIRDFEAIGMLHGKLGMVHEGFLQGMEPVWESLKSDDSPILVIGHSLGAARAAILTGLMCADGRSPIERVCWGEPSSGWITLADLIKHVPTRSFRNGNNKVHDPVTDVPPLPYIHATPLIDVCAPPISSLIPSEWHHMDLYALAMTHI